MKKLRKRVSNTVAALALGALVVLLLTIWFVWFDPSRSIPTVVDVGTTTPATINAATTLPSKTAVVEVKKTASVNSIISSLVGESTFASYLTSTGVAATLSGKGPYTVFVPSNAAFSWSF